MRGDGELQSIYRHYTRLKRESENHRYECYAFNAAEANRVRSILYNPLAARMRNLLGVS